LEINLLNPAILDILNRSREETTSSFFLKKISNMENNGLFLCFLLENGQNLPIREANTEGSLFIYLTLIKKNVGKTSKVSPTFSSNT
jgi:hypothetical protein